MSETVARYTFLPWLRQGVAANIQTIDPLTGPSGIIERAGVTVSLAVNNRDPLDKHVQLIGPGDILGLNPSTIFKTEPRHWVTDFEPNYLPYVEFYNETFCWQFTPAAAAHSDGDANKSRLRPWLFLLVMAEGEFTDVPSGKGPLSSIKVSPDAAQVFPKSEELWAWAHVHVSQDITNDATNTPSQAVDALENTLRQNPDRAYSRLVNPRKLRPDTAYHAFIVPSFETGRLAGLGLPTAGIDALEPSWGNGQVDYPVYYRYYFRTGTKGDFEFLVNLLEPRPVDDRVGIRDMDMQMPGFEVDGLTNPDVMGLEGALRKPLLTPRPETWPPAPPPQFLLDLQQKVNLPQVARESGSVDPVVSPPLYGRWHAKVQKMDFAVSGWVN